jgi:hypothetical protein
MENYTAQIENKYQKIAKIPEFLLRFTIVIRKTAIGHLNVLAQRSNIKGL